MVEEGCDSTKSSLSNQEDLMQFLSYITLWYLTIIVLFSFVQIVFFKVVDILFPVQFIGIFGLVYWLIFVVSGIYYQIKEKKINEYTVLITKFVLAGLTFVGFTRLPSALSFSFVVHIPLTYSESFYGLFIVGLLAVIVGLVLSILNYGKGQNN